MHACCNMQYITYYTMFSVSFVALVLVVVVVVIVIDVVAVDMCGACQFRSELQFEMVAFEGPQAALHRRG